MCMCVFSTSLMKNDYGGVYLHLNWDIQLSYVIRWRQRMRSHRYRLNKIKYIHTSLSLSLSFHKNKTTEKYFFSAFGVITQSPSIKMICKENINHYICESNKYSIFIAISILKINISLKFINDINLSGISDTLSLQIFVLFYFYLLN